MRRIPAKQINIDCIEIQNLIYFALKVRLAVAMQRSMGTVFLAPPSRTSNSTGCWSLQIARLNFERAGTSVRKQTLNDLPTMIKKNQIRSEMYTGFYFQFQISNQV